MLTFVCVWGSVCITVDHKVSVAPRLSSVLSFSMKRIISVGVHVPQEAGERKTAHNNGWDGVNGKVSNSNSDVFDTIPIILF